MGFVLGGLGILSLHPHGALSLLHGAHLRSVIILLLLVIGVLVLAYVTNPSESQFRKFLTELTVRHHLTRLSSESDSESAETFSPDGNNHFNYPPGNNASATTTVLGTPSKSSLSQSHTLSRRMDGGTLHNLDTKQQQQQKFHFSCRVSLSLRTPHHLFRNFGIFSVAFVGGAGPSLLPLLPGAANGHGHHIGLGITNSSTGLGAAGIISANGSPVKGNADGSPTTPGSATHPNFSGGYLTTAAIEARAYIGIFGSFIPLPSFLSRTPSHHQTQQKFRSLRSRKGEEVGIVLPTPAAGGRRIGLLGIREIHDDDTVGYKPTSDPQALSTPRGLRNRSSSRSSLPSQQVIQGQHNTHSQSKNQQQPQQPRDVFSAPPQRTTTPPPLPVGASLPLHATRNPGDVGVREKPDLHVDKQHFMNDGSVPCSAHLAIPPIITPADPSVITDPLAPHKPISRQPSLSTLESSPVLAPLLAQLSSSQSGISVLRSQLSSQQSSSADQRKLLEDDVEALRAKKRAEDTQRGEVKSRLRTLEEEKRLAENKRRNGEKKVKEVQSKQDEIRRRIERLRVEMSRMHQAMGDGEQIVQKSGEETKEKEDELAVDLENKRREIDVCEKVVSALGDRVRDMNEEKKDLERKRSELVDRHEELVKLLSSPSLNASPLRNTLSKTPSFNPSTSPIAASASPRPRPLSLGGISNLAPRSANTIANTNATNNSLTVEPSQGHNYPGSAPISVSIPQHANTLPLPASGPGLYHSRFSPFDIRLDSPDTRTNGPNGLAGLGLMSPISPVGGSSSLSLIPSGIMESPRSTDEEGYFASKMPFSNQSGGAQSRTNSLSPKNSPGKMQSELTVPELTFNYTASPPLVPSPANRFDAQRAIIKPSISEPLTPLFAAGEVGDLSANSIEERDRSSDNTSVKSRRWFGREKDTDKEKDGDKDKEAADDKPKKGLNPDAKIFSFSRKSSLLSLRGNNPTITTAPTTIDPLNPSGAVLPPQTPRSSFFTSLRAFQPSPAEREALRMAMESTNNSSLERISSRGSHKSGHSPTATTSPLLHNPFSSPRATLPSITHPHLNSGTAGRTDFGIKQPWSTALSSPTSDTTAVNDGDIASASAPPHKKSFSFNPWGQDKLLGSK